MPPTSNYGDEYFSDEVLQYAKTARAYIEHLYKVQNQHSKERKDRYVGSRVIERVRVLSIAGRVIGLPCLLRDIVCACGSVFERAMGSWQVLCPPHGPFNSTRPATRRAPVRDAPCARSSGDATPTVDRMRPLAPCSEGVWHCHCHVRIALYFNVHPMMIRQPSISSPCHDGMAHEHPHPTCPPPHLSPAPRITPMHHPSLPPQALKAGG